MKRCNGKALGTARPGQAVCLDTFPQRNDFRCLAIPTELAGKALLPFLLPFH